MSGVVLVVLRHAELLPQITLLQLLLLEGRSHLLIKIFIFNITFRFKKIDSDLRYGQICVGPLLLKISRLSACTLADRSSSKLASEQVVEELRSRKSVQLPIEQSAAEIVSSNLPAFVLWRLDGSVLLHPRLIFPWLKLSFAKENN